MIDLNGWKRLWIFLSAIWVVLAITLWWIIIPDKFTVGPWTLYGLSEKSQKYFFHDEEVTYTPYFKVEIEFTNGAKQTLRFPILEEKELKKDYWIKKVDELAIREGTRIKEHESLLFFFRLKDENAEAIKAKNEFDQKVESAKANADIKRYEVTRNFTLFGLIPPFILLLIGYGVAWVRRGFSR